MSKPKLTPLAQCLRLASQLSDTDKQTLSDFLRPERQRPKSSSGAQGASGRSSRKPKVAPPAAITAADLENASSAAAGGD